MNFLAVVVAFVCLVIAHSLIPPKSPPEELVADYTFNHSVPLEFFYVDDTKKGDPTHFVFSKEEIDSYIAGAERIIRRFQLLQAKALNVPSDVVLPWVAASAVLQQLPKSQWVQFGLFSCRDYIKGKKIGVIGSMEPWVESFLIALGAKEVATIEYNRLTYAHPQIRTFSQSEFDQLYRDCSLSKVEAGDADECHAHSFDFIISPSAFDHDGLGRYGDPLDPWGDIGSMKQMEQLLRRHGEGFLFLTVPIGPDVVVFNLHRRYGPIRLPLLLGNWSEVARLGWNDDRMMAAADWRQTYEPIFLLTPPSASPVTVTESNDDGEL